MHKTISSALCVALIGVSTIGPAASADASDGATPPKAPSYPNIEIEGSAELQAQTIRPQDPDGRINEAFATIEPEITLNVSEQFSLVAHLLYEPVEDADPGTTEWFAHQGLYAEELYARVTLGNLVIGGGKLDPVFGLASDLAPGVYGSDIAESYDYKGALGGRVQWQFAATQAAATGGDVTRTQSLDVSVFSADTTFLSRSLFTDRGELSIDDGGVGNSGRPDSFALAYNVRTVNGDDEIVGPAGQLALRRLAKGADEGHDEWGLLGSGMDVLEVTDGVTLTALAEAAYFVHQAGGDADAASGTLGAELREGPWIESVTAAAVRTFGDEAVTDGLITASLGRDLDLGGANPLRVDAAYARSETDGVKANTFGLRLHQDFSWSSVDTSSAE